MTKEEDKNIDEDVLQWFSHIERMENDNCDILSKSRVHSFLAVLHGINPSLLRPTH